MNCPDQQSSAVYAYPDKKATACDYTVDFAGRTKTPGLLRKLGQRLQFPDWYGENFDALYDCLANPEWPKGNKPVLIRLSGLPSYANKCPEDFSILLAVLQTAMDTRNTERSSAVRILIDATLPSLAQWPEP